jgi:hypothetical protein
MKPTNTNTCYNVPMISPPKLDQKFGSFFSISRSLHTSIHTITILKQKLSNLLNIPCKQLFCVVTPVDITTHNLSIQTIRHQNFIGWDLFIKGFISPQWASFQKGATASLLTPRHNARWDEHLLNLHNQHGRNVMKS